MDPNVLMFTSWSSLGRRDPGRGKEGRGGGGDPGCRRTLFGSRGSEDEADSTCLENPCMSFPKLLGIYDTRAVVEVQVLHLFTLRPLSSCT